MKKKILSILLTAAILFTTQGMPVSAESVTNRNTQNTGADAPSNPVHNCKRCTYVMDGTNTTTWSYVYFGSYPQTEVTGAELTGAITRASYDANGDTWVNGTKYRRIRKSDTNDTQNFGSKTYRYFKWEKIKWRVLNVNDSTMFVAADTGLDCKRYNDPGYYDGGNHAKVTWETCSLRNWLNHDFYEMAFGSEEQEAIVPQTVANDIVEYGGNSTTDKVYLPSRSDVMNPNYGFCKVNNIDSVSRREKASDYAYVRGASVNTSNEYAGNCSWWLRTKKGNMSDAENVQDDCIIDLNGRYVIATDVACVPVLHIKRSSAFWYTSRLTAAKEESKKELVRYKEAKDETRYREAQQKELSDAAAAGKAAIDAAEDEEGVQSALAAAKEAIDQIKTDAQLALEEQKNAGGGTKTEVHSETTEKTVSEATSIEGKIKAKSKGFLVKWKKASSVTGYQIQYSTSRKFTKTTTKMKTVNKASKKKLTVRKLKASKKYYIRIRTYKTVNGKEYNSPWSAVKSVKTKK